MCPQQKANIVRSEVFSLKYSKNIISPGTERWGTSALIDLNIEEYPSSKPFVFYSISSFPSN